MKKIYGYIKFKGRRIFMKNKVKENISVKDLLIEEIEETSSNDWNELCDICSSLIKEAGMTEKDIDKIVEKVKKGNA